MRSINFLYFIFLFFQTIETFASTSQFHSLLKKAILDQFAPELIQIKIELDHPIDWIRSFQKKNNLFDLNEKVEIMRFDGLGYAYFQWIKPQINQIDEGRVAFHAWWETYCARLTIRAHERLQKDLFLKKRINLSKGKAFEYRHILYPVNQALRGLETLQTIPIGHFLTTTAVRSLPDIRKGDLVQVHFLLKNLTLKTTGVSQETAYFLNDIKILAGKYKKPFIGKLISEGLVEVSL